MLLSNLSIGYGARIVQADMTCTIPAGQLVCLLGPNGSGKSTLLRTLSGLQPAISGQVMLDGHPIESLTPAERAKYLSLVLTERLSLEQTRVVDIVAMGRSPYTGFLGRMSEADRTIVAEALASVEATPLSDAYFASLSDGEKARVLIAKALAQQTPYILLDEPTAHLDLPSRINTLLLLSHLAHTTGRTIIISTHELDLALQLSDRVLLLRKGGGYWLDTPSSLLASGALTEAFADKHFSFSPTGNILIHL